MRAIIESDEVPEWDTERDELRGSRGGRRGPRLRRHGRRGGHGLALRRSSDGEETPRDG